MMVKINLSTKNLLDMECKVCRLYEICHTTNNKYKKIAKGCIFNYE